MIRGNALYYLLGLVLLAGSCSDPWETRFVEGGKPGQTVWQLLAGNDSYSKFRNLLMETGGDTLLQRNTSFTVLVVPDEYFPELSGSSAEEKAGAAAYHLSNFILYSGDIVNGTTLKTLNGKRLSFSISGEGYTVNDVSLLLRTNLLASNGVIHEVNGLLKVRPNLLEYLNQEEKYSYIADYFAQGTEVTFDEANSVPIGIDEDGQTIYDTVWKQSNEFFTNLADLGSEDVQYTFFLASDNLLDTTAEGSYKSGYISNIANFIVDGIVFETELPGTFQAVNGFSLSIIAGNYTQPEKLSNGWAYAVKGFQGMRIPGKLTWEITDVSDFDSIRHVTSGEYASIYDRLQDITVSDLTGSLTSFKYDFDPGALNGDYLKIRTTSGTTLSIGIKLPDLLPAKYMVRMGGVLRGGGGLAFDAYMNGEEIGSKLNMNGGDLTWKVMDIGVTTITSEKGNILTLDVTGGTRGDIDYLSFEPVK